METSIYMTFGLLKIKPQNAPKNMKEITSFACHNNLTSLCKLQGGYYFINKNRQFEFLARALHLFSFKEYYDKAKIQ